MSTTSTTTAVAAAADLQQLNTNNISSTSGEDNTSKTSLDTSFQLPECHSTPMPLSLPPLDIALAASAAAASAAAAASSSAANTTDEDDDHISNQMTHLMLQNGNRMGGTSRANSGDAGSDSGVDIDGTVASSSSSSSTTTNTAHSVHSTTAATPTTIGCSVAHIDEPSDHHLQRALSSTSGGYASSNGGAAAASDPLNDANSCASSVISCCSEDHHHRLTSGGSPSSALSSSSTTVTSAATMCRLRQQHQHHHQQDCTTSEGGSESSSISGAPAVNIHRKSSLVRKRVALIEPSSSSSACVGSISASPSASSAVAAALRKEEMNAVARSRARTASANRTALQQQQAAASATRDRARSRDNRWPANCGNPLPPTVASPAAAGSSSRTTPLRRAASMRQSDAMAQSPRTPHSTVRTPSSAAGQQRGGTGGRITSNGLMLTPTQMDSGDGPASGRWSMSSLKSQPSNGGLVIRTKCGPISLESPNGGGHVATDKTFATLPRRRKEKSDDDMRQSGSMTSARSTSAQRGFATDRMTVSSTSAGGSGGGALRRQHSVKEPAITSPAHIGRQSSTPARRTTMSGMRAPPPPPTPQRTKIYHETAAQTALTAADVANAMAGVLTPELQRPIDAVDTETRGCQVDIRDIEIEALHEQLRRARIDVGQLQGAVNERGQQLLAAEQQLARERDEKQAMAQELRDNTQRILGMLALVDAPATSAGATSTAAATAAADSGADSLLLLESQIQHSGHVLEAKQTEIDKLYGFCRQLQSEMQRSQCVQRTLLVEKQELEKESSELQDFLQDEKSTLVDALRDAEADTERTQTLLALREADIERLQEECRHLVRISEQRRHEYLGMQSKYTALEQRSRDLIVHQGSAVSGASMALAGLGARLDQLVGQLISSYSISEQELEDVVFHNEAYTADSAVSSAAATPGDERPAGLGGDATLSPQRHQSFIVAVISAIRNAAGNATHKQSQQQQQNAHKSAANGSSFSIDDLPGNGRLAGGVTSASAANDGNESDTTEMLDSETEPCLLMMENVLEDVAMPDAHSHNLVSTSSSSLHPTTAPTMCSSELLQLKLTDVAAPHPAMGKDEQSIHNLSQAIYMRQQIEQQLDSPSACSEDALNESMASLLSNGTGGGGGGGGGDLVAASSAQPLVDQIIGVDNLVTKLLKVLRIIQMDNDQCIQQLIGDKNTLQLTKEELMLRLHDWEQLNVQLRHDLDTATGQLSENSSELAHSKVELQRHRCEIDRLNVDICNLSTLCQNNKTPTSMSKPDIRQRQNALNAFAQPTTTSQLIAACQENPQLKHQLLNELNAGGMNSNGRPAELYRSLAEAIVDTKRQYEAIDRALETLNGMHATVQQCPALLSLQRDLEETNFASATNIPIYTAILTSSSSSSSSTNAGDCNANGNGRSDASTVVPTTAAAAATTAAADEHSNVASATSNSSPSRRQSCRIDSTA